MEMNELAEWMKQRDIANSMKNWIHSAWVNGENYTAVEDLVTEGKANVTIALVQGTIRISKAETFEGDFEDAKVELVEAKKTVKAQEKTIKSLEKQVESLKEEKNVNPKINPDLDPDFVDALNMPEPTADVTSKLKPKKVKK